MHAGRLIAWSAGAALTAAWIAAATTAVQPVPQGPTLRPAERPVEAPLDLAEESRRVRHYALVAPAPQPLGRNPFAFGPSREPDRPTVVLPDATAPEAGSVGVEPREVVIVIGIATETSSSGGPELTAIVSVDGRMRFVKVGDGLTLDLEVAEVDSSGITVRETLSGTLRRLTLP